MVAVATRNLLMTGDVALQLGISADKLERQRKAGRIPEFIRVGRLHVLPADAVPVVRARLIESGHIDPERERPFIRAGVEAASLA